MDAQNVALVSLATNIVLVIVTAAYATVTLWMACSAKASAEAAQRAAEANETSARAAMAALNIELSIDPMHSDYFQLYGLEVRNTGEAIVHVHHLELTYVLLGRLGTGTKPGPVAQPDISISPENEDEYPKLLHRNDSTTFNMGTSVGKDPSVDVVSFAGFVRYSISGEPDDMRAYPFVGVAEPAAPEPTPRGSLGHFL